MKKITVFLNAYSQGISGADKICIETWKHLKSQNVTCVTSQNGKKLCEKLKFNCSFKTTTFESIFRNPVLTYLKRIFFGIWIAILSPKQDILYSSSDQLPDILPAVVMKLRNADATWIVRSYHKISNNRGISHNAQKLSWFIMRWLSATIITASSLMKKELTQYGFTSENIHIVFPGITQVKTTTNLRASKTFDAVFLSRLHVSKGVFDLIEIWKHVVKKIPKATLAMIGTGEDDFIQKLHEKISRNNLEKSITLLGYLSDNDARQVILSSKMFVFPSHEEGFSLTIAEVLSSEVPVVSYDLPIFRDVFPDALVTVPCFDINSFSDKIIYIYKKPKIYQKKSIRGKQIIKKYSWNHATENERKILDL